MTLERAETRDLERLLSHIGAGLDQYLRFEQPDALQSSTDWKRLLDRPLPQTGVGIDAVVEELTQVVIQHGSPIPRPGFCAWITTGTTTAPVLASAAASVASPQRYLRTAFNFLEELSLEWLATMCGIPDLRGVYSTGGSVANLIALGGARQSAFEGIGRDPAATGIDRRVAVFASEECHHTIQRACGVLGLGRRAVNLIPCDERGRMKVDELRRIVDARIRDEFLPVAIVANAGTTNTGVIDPLSEIGQFAAENGIWFHVDGAYGLPGRLDERVAHLYEGLERADSVIVDPHKWLGAPVGIAATFVRDRRILGRAFTQEPADYLEGTIEAEGRALPAIEHSMDDFGERYYDYGVELSSPCRGIMMWAMLREIGVEGMRERIVRHNDMARYIDESARRHPHLEVLSEPVLSICCFRYVHPRIDNLDRFNERLYRQLVRENEIMPSTTRIQGKLALRPCFIGARTEFDHANRLIEAVLRIGGELVERETSGR